MDWPQVEARRADPLLVQIASKRGSEVRFEAQIRVGIQTSSSRSNSLIAFFARRLCAIPPKLRNLPENAHKTPADTRPFSLLIHQPHIGAHHPVLLLFTLFYFSPAFGGSKAAQQGTSWNRRSSGCSTPARRCCACCRRRPLRTFWLCRPPPTRRSETAAAAAAAAAGRGRKQQGVEQRGRARATRGG